MWLATPSPWWTFTSYSLPVLIGAPETKTGTPIRMPLNETLSAAVDHYIGVHRPVLAQRQGYWWQEPGAALWVSSHGSPMKENALYDRIVRATCSLLGRPINPHLFRDCVATTLAIDDPAHVRIAASMLGHTTFTTTEHFYNQADARQAAQGWQDHVGVLRKHPAHPDDADP
jgi:integrase/recombinase XerD